MVQKEKRNWPVNCLINENTSEQKIGAENDNK